MTARTKIAVFIGFVALLIWGFVISQVKAAQPTTILPIDYQYDMTTVAALWNLDDGQQYCAVGTITGSLDFIWSQVKAQKWTEQNFRSNFEALTQKNRLINAGAEEYFCQQLWDRNPVNTWIVDQWRTNPTRPVYEINDQFPSVKNKIGDIPFNTPCGVKIAPYSATITAYEWRSVTLPGGQQGASVCRKK